MIGMEPGHSVFGLFDSPWEGSVTDVLSRCEIGCLSMILISSSRQYRLDVFPSILNTISTTFTTSEQGMGMYMSNECRYIIWLLLCYNEISRNDSLMGSEYQLPYHDIFRMVFDCVTKEWTKNSDNGCIYIVISRLTLYTLISICSYAVLHLDKVIYIA